MFDTLRHHDIYDAVRRLEGICVRTPLRRSGALSRIAGGDVWLKHECQQVTGSFKLRGAYNAIATLPEDVRARGVVTSSAGNHGLGVAWAAKHLAIPATVFVPLAVPDVKRRGIEALGASIDAESADYDDAMVRARAFAGERGTTYIHPCLGEALIAGQGTVALEVLEDLPDLATIVVPVGGAGLLAGTGSLLRRTAPSVRISGAQSVHTAAMSRSLAAGRVTHIEHHSTLADGLAGDIDEFALDVGRKALDELTVLEEAEIARAIRFLIAEEGLTVEGAGAVGVGALLKGTITPTFPCVAIITGCNIDPKRHLAAVAGTH